jgi:hypothetical protein
MNESTDVRSSRISWIESIASYCHRVLGHELLRQDSFAGTRDMGMDDSLFKIPNSTLTQSFIQSCQHFAHIIPRVASTPTLNGDNNCKPGRILGDSEHHFERNCHTFSIRNFSTRREPYAFMIVNGPEPGLIQGHDIVPVSGIVSLESRQKGFWTLDPYCLLIVRQAMWRSSEMMGGRPKSLTELSGYHGFM